MVVDQLFQRFHTNQRHVAGEHKHERIRILELASRRLDGVAGAALLCLDHETRELSDFSEYRLLNFFSLMTNDDEYFLRIESLRRSDHVRDQRRAAELVQHF